MSNGYPANNVYIGARYVPKLVGEWDSTKETAYEPLIIVTYQGNSYTSRQYVPAGIDISNTEYWVLTGNFNGQIAALDERVNQLLLIADTPQKFGATGDGIHDDTEAFKNLFRGDNKTIYIPKGNYLITDSIALYSNCNVICHGIIIDKWKGVGLQTQTGLFDANNKDNINITGMHVVGTGAGGNGTEIPFKELLSFNDCNNIKIEALHVLNTNASFVVRFNHCNYCTAIHNFINGYSYSGIACIKACKNINVSRNTVLNCKNLDAVNTYPISLSLFETEISPNQEMAENGICDSNFVFNESPWWDSIDAHGGNNFVFTNNVLLNCAGGISFFGDATRNFTASNGIIANNIVHGTRKLVGIQKAFYGIKGRGTNIDCHDNLVEGFSSGTEKNAAAIYLSGKNHKIHHNTILNTRGNGIMVDDFGGDISCNTIDGVTCTVPGALDSGIGIYPISGNNYGNSFVHHNIIKNCEKAYTRGFSTSGYTRFYENVYDDMTAPIDKFIRANAINYGVPDVATNPDFNDAQGHKLDFIKNLSLAEGQPIGWICTQSKTANAAAVWKAVNIQLT